MKLLYYTWFRTESEFFSGELFDLLESFSWNYLVKVKLKNLDNLLKVQDWTDVEDAKDVAICEFSYQAKSWLKELVRLLAFREICNPFTGSLCLKERSSRL